MKTNSFKNRNEDSLLGYIPGFREDKQIEHPNMKEDVIMDLEFAVQHIKQLMIKAREIVFEKKMKNFKP